MKRRGFAKLLASLVAVLILILATIPVQGQLGAETTQSSPYPAYGITQPWPLDIPIAGIKGGDFGIGPDTGRFEVPALTVCRVMVYNPIGRVADGVIEPDKTQELFALIRTAKARKVAPDDEVDNLDFDGSSLGIVVMLENGRYSEIVIDTFNGFIGATITLDFAEEFSREFALESEALKTFIHKLCQWDAYDKSELKGANAIVVFALKQVEDRGAEYTRKRLGKITKKKAINNIANSIQNAQVLGCKCGVTVLLEFQFSDRTTREVYLKAPGHNGNVSVVAGQNEFTMTKKGLVPIWSLLPKKLR